MTSPELVHVGVSQSGLFNEIHHSVVDHTIGQSVHSS